MRKAQTRRIGTPFIYEAADAKFREVVDYYDDELEEILDDAIKVAHRGR
jgi:hypothetical protein